MTEEDNIILIKYIILKSKLEDYKLSSTSYNLYYGDLYISENSFSYTVSLHNRNIYNISFFTKLGKKLTNIFNILRRNSKNEQEQRILKIINDKLFNMIDAKSKREIKLKKILKLL